jgi:PAS domain S-box-containing protein
MVDHSQEAGGDRGHIFRPVEYYRSTFVKSLAMIPIEDDSPIGAIGLYWASSYRPTRQQLTGLERLADIAGLALQNTQLVDELRNEVTERSRAEEQVRRQAALLDEATDAILVCDLDGDIIFWSKGAERTYGWTAEEALGKPAGELHRRRSDPTYSQAGQVLLEAGHWSGEIRHATKDGRELVVQSRWTLLRDRDGKPEAILIINTDVTGEKKREAEFLRAQRMESLGTLAGGIAHDINNVLSPILMAIRLLETSPPGEGTRRVLDVLQTNVERGANMVRQILEFARGVEGERMVLQPEHLIKQIIYVLGGTLSKSIKIRFSALDKLWAIRADPTQIHQVLMNLLVNAQDAMPGGGEITIEAGNVSVDENYSRMMPDAKPGRYVRIAMRDTGTGIARDKIERIFEPFFTTKGQGKGTGLGLSTALAIVKSHGGFIGVYSEENKGTEFKIYLPAVDINAAVEYAGDKGEVPKGHGELVLVADDEAAVREITRSTLEACGYKVLTAGDGTEAVAVFAEHSNEIKLVLIDTMMPYMDGPSAIRAMRRLNPDIRVILNSGMAQNGASIEDIQVNGFLGKPHTADQLLNALAAALKERG